MATRVAAEPTAPSFPSGQSRAIAVLVAEPAELAERHGLRFEAGRDDLDDFRYAAIDIGDGAWAWLSRHRGDPNPGTIVRVDAAVRADAAIGRLSSVLGLHPSDILWQTDGS